MYEELFNRILKHIRGIYPQYNIELRPKTKLLMSLWVENKKLTDYNPEQLLSEIEWFKDRDDYIDLASNFFLLKIKNFHRKYIKIAGRNSKGITIQEVKEACSTTKSNKQASRFLKVSYNTWKKYASMYINESDEKDPKRSYFETHMNPTGRGITKPHGPHGAYGIEAIMAGHCSPNYPAWKLKEKLIKSGYKHEECDNCGFNEKRLTDKKVPLIVNFIDGNIQNRRIENIQFLCYNCYYLIIGDIFWGRKGGAIKDNNTHETFIKPQE